MSDEFKYTQQTFENPEAIKRERRYALLQASARIYTAEPWQVSFENAVTDAEGLLAEIEKRET